MGNDFDKQNILLIMTDQHRLSAVGAYGETPCKTPNIDRLAENGVLFKNAYTTCPVCSPARASIMTGKYPHAHGITTNIHETGCSVHELEDGPNLLSRQLEKAGYTLGYSGKWHLGTDLKTTPFGNANKPCLPKDVGFEGQNFPGHGGGGFAYQEYAEYLQANGFEHTVGKWDEATEQIWPMGKLTGPVESTVPYFLAENTISMIDDFSEKDQPFFIWHNFWGPHGPFFAPEEFVDLYRDVKIPQWPNYDWPALDTPGPHQAKIHPRQENLHWEDWEMAIRYYYAFTTLIDRQIGRMMDHLEAKGLLENTTVIFTADHGQTLGSHGGLTDKGWHHFEETHRIPMIMRSPETAGERVVINELVSSIDIYPTLLDIAGGECDEADIHGRSLLPLMNGTTTKWRDCVVTEFNGLGNSCVTQRTLRKGNLKYGFNNCGECELYDLEKDPWETRNLINDSKYEKELEMLVGCLLRWMEKTNDRVVNRFKNHQKTISGIAVSPTS